MTPLDRRIRRKVLAWHGPNFGGGQDVGLSSEAMAWHLAGMGWPGNDHPCDPSDLNRCVKLLRAVPELRARLGRMRKVSPIWARLLARWDELERLLAEEIAEGTGSAPRTYNLMKELGA